MFTEPNLFVFRGALARRLIRLQDLSHLSREASHLWDLKKRERDKERAEEGKHQRERERARERERERESGEGECQREREREREGERFFRVNRPLNIVCSLRSILT